MRRPRLSIVAPVFRNRETLDELHERIVRAVARYEPLELLFVDDASPDDSLEVLREIASRDARVRVAALADNVGQNLAILAGFAFSRGETVVALDADLQDPPEAIPLLVDAIGPKRQVIFAGRRGAYESRAKLATSRLFKRALHVASRRRVPVDAGLFFAMSRDAVERVLAVGARDPHVVALVAAAGVTTSSIPVERARNPNGRTSYTTASRLRVAWRSARTIAAAGRPSSGGYEAPPLREWIDGAIEAACPEGREGTRGER
jgi:glycosyltransferase involved in cell wall biosynthesis